MATGICRAVLAWYSPRLGAHATSLGDSSARAVPSSSSASTVNVWAPTSAVADQCRALTHAAGQSSGGGPGDRIDAEADFRSVSHLGDAFRQILAVEENDVAVGLAYDRGRVLPPHDVDGPVPAVPGQLHQAQAQAPARVEPRRFELRRVNHVLRLARAVSSIPITRRSGSVS
jgi:hypothetical protein